MADRKKTTTAAALLVAFSAGAGADRLINPAPEHTAIMRGLRVLDEGPSKPHRYAFAIELDKRRTPELVCGNQGSVDSFGMLPFDHDKAKAACEAAARFAPEAQALIDGMRDELAAASHEAK